MKKILLPLIAILLFIPVIVKAEEKIYIDSIEIDEIKGEAVELEPATANDKTINLNLRMSNKDDEIKYKLVIKNDSEDDFTIDKNSITISSDYMDYSLESDDNNIIKANSSKIIYLRVKYSNEVDPSKFVNGVYQDNITMRLNLKSDDNILNPNTGLPYLIIISLVLIISGVSLILFKKKKISALVIIIGLIILPIGVKALKSYEIELNSKVTITKTRKYKAIFLSCQGPTTKEFDYEIGMTWRNYMNSSYYNELLEDESNSYNIVTNYSFERPTGKIRFLYKDDCDEENEDCEIASTYNDKVTLDSMIISSEIGEYYVGESAC